MSGSSINGAEVTIVKLLTSELTSKSNPSLVVIMDPIEVFNRLREALHDDDHKCALQAAKHAKAWVERRRISPLLRVTADDRTISASRLLSTSPR